MYVVVDVVDSTFFSQTNTNHHHYHHHTHTYTLTHSHTHTHTHIHLLALLYRFVSQWITDLNTAKLTDFNIKQTKVKVHAGFLLAYQTVRSSVLQALSTLVANNPRMSVLFTGHSLGAALAHLS
jgi:hypothetical protein